MTVSDQAALAAMLREIVGTRNDDPRACVVTVDKMHEAWDLLDRVEAGNPAERNLMRAKTLLVYLWRMHDSGGISMGRSRENVLLETAQALLGEPDMGDLVADEGKNVGEARNWISEIRRKRYEPKADDIAGKA